MPCCPIVNRFMEILDDLTWRGLLADCTDLPALRKRVRENPVTLYCGFDPTGDSLHVGHLMGQLTLRRFQIAGHRPLALAGGATGMIGDPSGKSSERNLLTREQLSHNVARIKNQLERLLDFQTPGNPARLVDNADWTAPVGFLDFLRDVGKHFPLNAMLAKESVRSRMEGDSGISYTEFSYQLLQAHDFYHLCKTFDCELQIGGSDQWGNITAGTDFIRRKLGRTAWGWTFPLITKSDGSKFGKTEEGTVWLDPAKTSPFKFYQFFINTEDGMVVPYLKKFTFLPREEIEAIASRHEADPGSRQAHRILAREITSIVHGETAMEDAVAASEVLFGAPLEGLSASAFADVAADIPGALLDPAELGGDGVALVDLLVQTGLCPSKGQARKDLQQGGIYLNNRRETDWQRRVTARDVRFDRYLLLRKGKKNYRALRLEESR